MRVPGIGPKVKDTQVAMLGIHPKYGADLECFPVVWGSGTPSPSQPSHPASQIRGQSTSQPSQLSQPASQPRRPANQPASPASLARRPASQPNRPPASQPTSQPLGPGLETTASSPALPATQRQKIGSIPVESPGARNKIR